MAARSSVSVVPPPLLVVGRAGGSSSEVCLRPQGGAGRAACVQTGSRLRGVAGSTVASGPGARSCRERRSWGGGAGRGRGGGGYTAEGRLRRRLLGAGIQAVCWWVMSGLVRGPVRGESLRERVQVAGQRLVRRRWWGRGPRAESGEFGGGSAGLGLGPRPWCEGVASG